MDNDAVAHGGEAWYVPTRLIITTGDTPSFSSQKKHNKNYYLHTFWGSNSIYMLNELNLGRGLFHIYEPLHFYRGIRMLLIRVDCFATILSAF